MTERHTVDKLFIAQDAGGRTITPRIVNAILSLGSAWCEE